MPTPRTASPTSSPFDFLPRLAISYASSGNSSNLSSSGGHGQKIPDGVSEPLLPRSHRPPSRSGSPTPSSVSRSPSRLASLGASIGFSPGSPTTRGLPPLPGTSPKAARLGSARRWVALLAVALVVGLALSAGQGESSGVDEVSAVTRLTSGWRSGLDGMRNWTAGRWHSGGGASGGPSEDADEDDVEAPTLSGAAVALEAGADADASYATKASDAGDDMVAPAEENLSLEGKAPEVQEMVTSYENKPPDEDEDGGSGGKDMVPEPTSPLNVHPVPRPAPRDPHVASQMRYLSFENHSGFHNQRKSLVNALVLAQLLNRTLLLPPARLGTPIPWEFDPKFRVAFSERCKAGLEPDKPIANLSNAQVVALGDECEDPSKWTYVGWDWLISPTLLAGRSLVDRWNASTTWLTAPLEEGGLGLRQDEIHQFEDVDRRSYQIFDDRKTPLDDGIFTSRIELDDLHDENGLGGKRLLQFGSLFSGARLKFTHSENVQLLHTVANNVVLQNDGLDAISDKIRDQLGSYIAAHARVGDGIFRSKAQKNMQNVFRQVVHDILGLRKAHVDALLVDYTDGLLGRKSDLVNVGKAKVEDKGKAKAKDRTHGGGKVPRAFGSAELSLSLAERADPFGPWGGADDVEEFPLIRSHLPGSRHPSPLASDLATSSLSRRSLKSGPSRSLAPNLHCRRPLHDMKVSPHLAMLNVPLYIATDSRDPTTDPALAPFNRWFPCIFYLNDFAEASEVNDEPVEQLQALVEGKSAAEGGTEWASEWDGQAMAQYLYPFLEAEIAARAVDVVGTPQSTFSGYVRGILHQAYVEQGLTAGWNSGA